MISHNLAPLGWGKGGCYVVYSFLGVSLLTLVPSAVGWLIDWLVGSLRAHFEELINCLDRDRHAASKRV